MLAAAAVAVLALSACGGSGGGGGTGILAPSLTAGGVTAAITHTGSLQKITITKGGTVWTDDPSGFDEEEPTSHGGWVWETDTKLNAPAATATERFRAVGTIASATDDDYLLYGYWAREPANVNDHLYMRDYKPFYYGKKPYTGNVQGQTGRVTYRGGATGVAQETDTAGDGSRVVGRFGIDAAVIVDFGSNTEAPELELRFVPDSFDLYYTDGSSGPNISGMDGVPEATATGPSFYSPGDSSGFKVWGGQFFGPSGSAPTGVAGWFRNLRTVGGSKGFLLHGTFAAKKID